MNQSASKPNIVFILTDQQRWDTCGCYGQQLPVTPELDRMARDGVVFEQAFTPQPLCTPARACLQTGRYATETGVFMLDIALPTDEPTIARFLGDAGYRVGYLGKWHLASTQERYAHSSKRAGQREPFECSVEPVPPDRRGGYRDFWLASNHLESTTQGYGGHLFDDAGRRREFPEGRHRVDVMTDWALEFLGEQSAAGQPFFLFLSYLEPHWQNNRKTHDAPYELEENFLGAGIPPDLDDFDGQPTWLIADWRQEYPRYLACCNIIDRNLGRLRRKLEDMGVADNTLIIFTSDHGCHFGKHNAGAKDSCHEASLRVPLVLHGPGFRGGRRCGRLASLIDLPPTLLQAAGAPIPVTMRGRPLQEAIDPLVNDWPEQIFFQISPSELGRGLRTNRWKYSVSAPDRSGWDDMNAETYQEAALFDLRHDPQERRNLVADRQTEQVRAGLREILARWMVSIGEPAPVILPAPPPAGQQPEDPAAVDTSRPANPSPEGLAARHHELS